MHKRYEYFSLSLTGDRPPKKFKTGIKAIVAAREYVAATGNTCPIYGWIGSYVDQVADVKADGRLVT